MISCLAVFVFKNNISVISGDFVGVDGATNIGVLEGKPSLTKLQTSFNELLVVLNTVCGIYNLP